MLFLQRVFEHTKTSLIEKRGCSFAGNKSSVCGCVRKKIVCFLGCQKKMFVFAFAVPLFNVYFPTKNIFLPPSLSQNPVIHPIGDPLYSKSSIAGYWIFSLFCKVLCNKIVNETILVPPES